MVDDVKRTSQMSACVRCDSEGRVGERRIVWAGLRRLLFVILVGVQLIAGAHPVWTQDYIADRAAGDELTSYLRRHRLPLVRAEVLKTAAGDERVVLYGFVASDFGKGDAKSKALEHIGKKGIPLENRIVVRPEIGKLKSSGAPGAAGGAKEPGIQTNESFDQVIDEIQRFGIKSPPGEENLGNP
jgi:hypothetical protein